MHRDGGGLYLQVSRSGGRSWIFRFQRNGKRRFMGLGSADVITLAEARDKAIDARRLLANGIDPIDQRGAERAAARIEAAKAVSFRECAVQYIAAHQAGWRNAKHAAQWPSTLEAYVFPLMGDLPVQDVDTGLVMRVLEPIWTVKPNTASRVRRRIEAVLDRATVSGHRTGDNPARWKGHLDQLLAAPTDIRPAEHHPALPYQKIAEFTAELRRRTGTAARALEFAILTAARAGEAIGARWDEINLRDRLWMLPGSRMKSGREHRVPLSGAALEITKVMAGSRSSDYVFPGLVPGRPLSHTALEHVMRRMGRDGIITVHGFRSSFADWASERTSYPADAIELALAHAVGDAVVTAYRRSDLFDRRRRLMDDWAAFCDAPPIADGEVVALRR
jgi:integrase